MGDGDRIVLEHFKAGPIPVV